MMTRRDPWVNMLRTTVAGLSAGVGGADAVTVLPFDAALGVPDAFARRIARNTQSVLLEESHLSKVIDPAGGSWYVEQPHRRAGPRGLGVVPGDRGRRRPGRRAALRPDRASRLAAHLAAPLTRTSPGAVNRSPVSASSRISPSPPVHRDPAPAPIGGGLPRVRRDDAYETLRSRSDAHLAASGDRPKVFLAALGPVATHTARVAFAANLFQAGGIETVAGARVGGRGVGGRGVHP